MLRKLLPHSYSADDEIRVLGQASQLALAHDINVLVWNIYKGRGSNWAKDFKALSSDRQLILLQESVLNAPTDYLFTQRNAMEWLMARSFRNRRSRVEHGLKTGCVVSAIDSGFYMSPHAEPVSQTQKLLLKTVYPIGDSTQQLLVINMHAINFVGVKKYVDQLDQLELALDGHAGPIILAGDFNTWNPARLTHFMSVADNANLNEAVMSRQGRLVHLNQHLDHVFYRGLHLESIDSLENYRSSDHAPIVAHFKYSG